MNQACIWTLVVLAVVVVAALIAIGVIVGLQQQQRAAQAAAAVPNLAARLADVDDSAALGFAAPHASAIPLSQVPRLGVPADGGALLPIEVQAHAVFDNVQANPPLGGCFAPVHAHYNAQNALMQENDAFVPSFQQVLKGLPATQEMNLQQQWQATNIGPQTREGIDQLSATTLDAVTRGADEDFGARVQQTDGVGSVAKIYGSAGGDARIERKGIALINQKSRMTDPSKLLPRVDPARQSERLVQAGPSIADIARRVPQAADIMKALKASRGSVLAQQLPRDKPPLYTQGLNAFRQTRLPPQQVGNVPGAIGISPLELSDVANFEVNPFLQASKAAQAPINYAV